ncbi:AMP-binding protein [Sphingobium yanoikuyae]|uniref:AMP-binding protein n=1 Tax=Sphingobium yanoikuyae TaxID=13690 RepID=UPI0022DD75BD|nr:AMP-binding protein [Sphingobium yanoikuyae]WBQ19112.1 AMP-binding protein [Sphingobium yanoikuyae]
MPTHFVRLLKLPDVIRAAYDRRSLRAVIHAAAPCPVPVKQAMIDWWGPIVHEYYSGTECCGITALSAPEWLAKPGSVGKAVLGRVKTLDDQGRELPAAPPAMSISPTTRPSSIITTLQRPHLRIMNKAGRRWAMPAISMRTAICS